MKDIGNWIAGKNGDLSSPEDISQLATEIRYAASDIRDYSAFGLNPFSCEQVRIAISLLEQAASQLELGSLYQARDLASR